MNSISKSIMSIEQSKLENGVSIALKTNSTARLVTLCFAIGTGTSRETSTNNGLAHMATHLHILGTHKRTAQDISKQIEQTGAEIQFFVHPEKTEYYLHLLPEFLETGIEIMADCLRNSVFSEDVLAREQTVIEQEIVERRDNPFVFGSDVLNEISFPGQGYGMCPLGTIESMYGLNVQMLKDYSSQYFYPKNMAIGAYGCISIQKLTELIQNNFGKYQNGDKQGCADRIKPIFKNDHKYICRPMKNELAHAFMSFPIKDETNEVIAAQIIGKVLGSGTSSHFFQELRQKRALGYTMGSRFDGFGGLSFLRFYFSGWKKEKEYNLLGEGAKVLNHLPKSITETEINSGKNKIIYDINMGIDHPFACAGMLAEQCLYGGNPTETIEYLRSIESIEYEEVKYLSEELLRRNPAVSFVGDYQPIRYDDLLNLLDNKKLKHANAA